MRYRHIYITLVWATLWGALLLSVSCQKEYHCTCTVTDENEAVISDTTTTRTFLSEGDAERWCEDQTDSKLEGASAICTLKQ